jgi:class 3 adenylate cyclase
VAKNVVRSFDQPDKTRAFPNGRVDLIKVGPLTFGLETLEPGWRWSVDVKPIAGTERCEFHHVGYQLSGRWIAEDREGNRTEFVPGELFDTPPGHDAWVVGDEPCVTLDVQGVADWAVRSPAARVLTTVLFADIVGSTALAERMGDVAWHRLLEQYREDVGLVLHQFSGTLVDTAGDGILARFDSPVGAVRAALGIIEASGRLGMGTRAGVHTGEMELSPKGLTGLAVHVGARVLAEAEPGEVVVTATTRDLTDGIVEYEARGTVELRGITGTRELFVARPA